jgi:dipeptidyl aminopeptidase
MVSVRIAYATDQSALNMLEMVPSTLDTSGRKKYPVLIRVYGSRFPAVLT